MLHVIQRYRKSFMGIVMVALVALLMTGFGVNLGSSRSGNTAIRVNDIEIAAEQFYQQRRMLENQYRRFMGEQFDRMASNFNIGQQVLDSMIQQALLKDKALEIKLRVSDAAVREVLSNLPIFSAGYNRAAYDAYLRQVGMNDFQFEQTIRDSAVAQELVELLSDVSWVSTREIQVALERENTQYTASYVIFEPGKFVEQVNTPDDEKLAGFYESHAGDYEQPARVSYDYLALDPKNFTDLVEILPEDLEQYYLEHETKFKTPEELKLRHVRLTFEQDKDPAKIVELKKKAEEVRQKAVGGEAFESLVAQYSDDLETSQHGGDLGWVKTGDIDGAIFQAALKTKSGGVAELAETDYGYHIVLVEGYHPSRQQELSEVQSEVEKLVRVQEAPGYLAAKAFDLFEAWQKSGSELSSFAVNQGLSAEFSGGLLEASKDPAGLNGLTKNVLKFIGQPRQIVELGKRKVLVQVKEQKEADIAPFDEVRQKVLESYKQSESNNIAKAKADEILASIAKGAFPGLVEAASAANLEIKTEEKLKPTGNSPGIFSNDSIRSAVFSAAKAGAAPKQVLEALGNYYLVQVTAIDKPDAAELADKIKKTRAQESESAAQTLVNSLVLKLKSQAEIDVQPGLI